MAQRVDAADVEETEVAEAEGSAVADNVTVYKMMNPSYDGPPLTKEQCCRLLPVATGVQFFWVLIFMLVELSGGAGGTSGVAGTRVVTLFVIYLLLILLALIIARSSANGVLNSPNLVLSYAIIATVVLAAMLGSSMSTFGMEVCNGSATLGPVVQNVTFDGDDIGLLLPQRSRCGIDSPGRGAKIVFEFLFSLVFGLPPLVAAFTVVISWDGLAQPSERRTDVPAPSMTANYVLATSPESRANGAAPLVFEEPGKRDLDMVSVQQTQKDEGQPVREQFQAQKEKLEKETDLISSEDSTARLLKEQEEHTRQLREELERERQEKQKALKQQELEFQKLQQLQLQQQQQREREMEEELVRTRELQLQQQVFLQRQQENTKARAEPPPSLHVALATPSPQVVRVGTIVSTQSSIEKLPFFAGITRETNGPFRSSDTSAPDAGEKERSPSPAGSSTSIISTGSRPNGAQVRSEARAVRDRAKAALAAKASSSSPSVASTQGQLHTAPKPRAPSEDYFAPAPAMLSSSVAGGEGDHIPDEDVDDIISQYLE